VRRAAWAAGSGAALCAALSTAALLELAAAAPIGAQSTAVGGGDGVRLRLPASARVEPYANAGYRLRVEEGVATVEVDLAPLRSRDPYRAGTVAGDPLATLARAVTSGARSRYEAASRLLGWVARNVTYDLDRDAPQDALAVLARRQGYCTGVARLTVALLQSVGIPAREVPGFVVASPGGGVPAGFHRWVEVRFEDVGWVFSDPLLSHHYVPATYVRLASERLQGRPEATPGLLLLRADRRQPVDLLGEGPPGVSVRRNDTRQRTGVLTVSVAGAASGRAVLEGEGSRRARALTAGRSTFLGLEPGRYLLRVEPEGSAPIVKLVTLRARVAASIHLSPAVSGAERETADPSPASPTSAGSAQRAARHAEEDNT
jgi:hypothetical protein